MWWNNGGTKAPYNPNICVKLHERLKRNQKNLTVVVQVNFNLAKKIRVISCDVVAKLYTFASKEDVEPSGSKFDWVIVKLLPPLDCQKILLFYQIFVINDIYVDFMIWKDVVLQM